MPMNPVMLRRAAEQQLSDSCRHEASGGKLLAVELTERVQLQWHCEGVDENSAALACEGVDKNARVWTKTRGNPDSCISECQQRIDAVCRAGSASAVPSAQPPKSEWKILFRNGNLTSALAVWCRQLWAGSGCGGSGRAPGWCGWAV